MTENNIVSITESLVDELLQEHPAYFRVHVKIKPTNNIKVFLDGDNGITIEKCTFFNRALYKMIEEKAIFPAGDFSLEVSSPGVDEPLRLHRQYTKNKGRFVEIIFNDGIKKEGKLLEVAKDDIVIEHTEGKGKKAITQQVVIPFSNIKTTTIQIKF